MENRAMRLSDNFPRIDIKKTGENIKNLIHQSNFTLDDIKDYLHLNSTQAIYHWMQGRSLPSIDNLYALSFLLNVSMEHILVVEEESYNVYVRNYERMRENFSKETIKRLLTYYVYLSTYNKGEK